MKKFLMMLLAVIMVLALVACDSNMPEENQVPSGDEILTEEKDSSNVGTQETVIEIPAVPVISVDVCGEYAVLNIQQVKDAERYDIYINGNFCNSVNSDGEESVTYKVLPRNVEVGYNEVYVCAANVVGVSENSEIVTVGKLADPIYHATGTGVEVIFGDVENAEGYALYGDDDAYITTMGLSGHYDFSSIYTAEGFYMCKIQAVADGWISSQMCEFPVMIGDVGGPYGPIE